MLRWWHFYHLCFCIINVLVNPGKKANYVLVLLWNNCNLIDSWKCLMDFFFLVLYIILWEQLNSQRVGEKYIIVISHLSKILIELTPDISSLKKKVVYLGSSTICPDNLKFLFPMVVCCALGFFRKYSCWNRCDLSESLIHDIWVSCCRRREKPNF